MSGLVEVPTEALALALGYSAARPSAAAAGRVTALVDELQRRGRYEPMMDALGDELASAIALVVSVDKAQTVPRAGARW